MARCEDFPCCGHELGCCPDYENGRQVNMRCTCGAVLPINNRSSICNGCLADDDESDLYHRRDMRLREDDERFRLERELAEAYPEGDDEYYDSILERQEMEDFERADEWYGDFGGGDEY